MKTSLLHLFTALTFVLITSCGNKAKEAETTKTESAAVSKSSAVSYITSKENSSIAWKGFKPTGSHNGAIGVEKGTLMLNNGTIESGTFEINMNTLEVLDIPKEEKGNAGLVGHLKNADFFDVEKFPTAKFEITGVKTLEGKTILSGNLTLKETTNNISFPVTTEIKDDRVLLTSETFTIDRSKWNIAYGSKSFFKDLGDKFINDDIELKVTLVANKA